MEPDFFFAKLYPFQDLVLRVVNDARTDFYLSGGTAASRRYLNHRFSKSNTKTGSSKPRTGPGARA